MRVVLPSAHPNPAAPRAAARLLAVGLVAAGLLAVAPASADAQAAKKGLDDPTIVAIFDAANTVDIETGQLAAERGSTKEVRDFGAMLVRDHKQVRQQGRDLAKKLGVTPTPPADDQAARDHKAAMARLSALKGTAFDRAFLAHEVAFHKAVIDAVNTTLLPAIQNGEVRTLVTTVAPAFQAHMMASQAMLDRMDGRSTSAGKSAGPATSPTHH
jgi:putative membrane protein